MTRTPIRLIAIALMVVLVASACGQKPGVLPEFQELLASGEATFDAEGNLIDPETGEVLATAEEVAASGIEGGTGTSAGGSNSSVAGGPTGSDSDGDGTPDGGGDGQNPDADGDGQPDPDPTNGPPGNEEAPKTGTTTGIEGDTIKIGGHAPVTGAAPVPASSFAKSARIYWDHIGNGINGRKVEAHFENDNFNPSTAVTKCRELVEDVKVFLLVGIAGADQIYACARYAEDMGVPYISGGVMQSGVESFSTYKAIWMSYAQQAPLLADMMVSTLGARDEKNGMIRFNTPGFTDGHDAFLSAMSKMGASVDYDRAVPKTAGQTDAQSVATDLVSQQIQNVFVLTSPTFFIQLAAQTSQQNYFPQWVGVGLTMTLDTVASAACGNRNSIDKAKFFSPTPAYFNADQYDKQFRAAGGTDDIQFMGWGIAKVIGELLKKPGRNLSRESFLFHAARTRGLSTGVLGEVSFGNTNFGGTSMHLNQANCSARRWETIKPFAKSF
jgi:branched-chain amino acid transport system substrate-binding protein